MKYTNVEYELHDDIDSYYKASDKTIVTYDIRNIPIQTDIDSTIRDFLITFPPKTLFRDFWNDMIYTWIDGDPMGYDDDALNYVNELSIESLMEHITITNQTENTCDIQINVYELMRYGWKTVNKNE